MFSLLSLLAIARVTCASLVATEPAVPDAIADLQRHPRSVNPYTSSALRSAVSLGGTRKRDIKEVKNNTSLEKSWDGAVLFSHGEQADSGAQSESSVKVEITCITCYLKGNATAELDFSVGDAFYNFTSAIKDRFDNITTTVVDYAEEYVKGVVSNQSDGIGFGTFDLSSAALDFDFDFDPPPIQLDFNLDVPKIPEARLRFQFDGMELYMLMKTVLSGSDTFTLNLYTSNSPIGLSVADDLQVGVVFAIDLILSADAAINISTGFHIKLEDGLAIEIPMFDKNVSNITFNGGNFEFLPVTLDSASGGLKAILRIGVYAGVEISSAGIKMPLLSDAIRASAGAMAGVFANVAEFTTNFTAANLGNDTSNVSDVSDCAIGVVESYQLALGAAAGASVALGSHTWGPTPETQIPIFYTTLTDGCASRRTSAITTTPSAATTAISARAEGQSDLTTTTLTTEVTYTGLGCLSTGLINCPASLQTTSKTTGTLTLVTSVPPGSEATFPPTTRDSVPSTMPFGNRAQALSPTTGSPVSYVPPPPPPPPQPTSTSSANSTDDDGGGGGGGAIDDIFTGDVHGVDKKVAIGVGVGVSVPTVLGIMAVAFYVRRRRMPWRPGKGVIRRKGDADF